MTFYEWRTQPRIYHALVLLADGHDTTQTAHACGWANPSSFIAAFTDISAPPQAATEPVARTPPAGPDLPRWYRLRRATVPAVRPARLHPPCRRFGRVTRQPAWEDGRVEVLSSRILLRPANLDRSRHFYRDVLGLAVYREFGPADDPSVVFFLGQGLLEVSGHAPGAPSASVMIWLQVRDVRAEHDRLAAAGARVTREPVREPWGLVEMWVEDPDGVRIVLVEVPADHPLRRDQR